MGDLLYNDEHIGIYLPQDKSHLPALTTPETSNSPYIELMPLDILGKKVQLMQFPMNYRGMGSPSIEGSIEISSEDLKELLDSLADLRTELEKIDNKNELGKWWSRARVTSNEVNFKDRGTGIEFTLNTSGFAQLRTAGGLLLQLTPDSFKFKGMDRELKEMNIEGGPIKGLSDAFAREAKKLISNFK